MKVGFTGTQIGMTPMQLLKVAQMIAKNTLTEVHIGDCVGADSEFLQLVQLANNNKQFAHIATHGHVPLNPSKRVFGKYDKEYQPKAYLDRNRDIVDASDVMIATPKERDEQQRSGTWATVRYAKKTGRKLVIVFPDGSIKKFNYGQESAKA